MATSSPKSSLHSSALTVREDSPPFRSADKRTRFTPAERPEDTPPPAAARRRFGFCQEYYRPEEFIRLPSWGRMIAGIHDTALFVGTGETFEIWSLEEALNSNDRTLMALAHSALQGQDKGGRA